MTRKYSRFIIWICAALWFAFVTYGFVAYMQLEPSGSGFTRGSNRIAAFFKWQAAALIPALAGYVIGRTSNAAGMQKHISRWPFRLSGGFFVLILLVFVVTLGLARFG